MESFSTVTTSASKLPTSASKFFIVVNDRWSFYKNWSFQGFLLLLRGQSSPADRRGQSLGEEELQLRQLLHGHVDLVRGADLRGLGGHSTGLDVVDVRQ